MANLSLRERIEDAISVARGNPPNNLIRAMSTQQNKDAPYAFQNVNNINSYERWDNKFSVYAKEGFEQNSIIYAAIMYKARAIALAPMRVYSNVDQPEPLARNHELQRLMIKPNRYMSGTYLQVIRSIYLNLSGNSYIFIDRDNRGNPVGLYPLRPDRVFIVPIDEQQVGYLYLPQGRSFSEAIPIIDEDMIHDKLPNPLDDMGGAGEGLSPISSSSMAADVDNKMSKFLNNLVNNGVMPTGLLVSDTQLTDKDAERMRRRFTEKYGGVNSWADVMVLDKRVSYERIGMTLQEMVVDNLDKRNEARILQSIGVSPILMGALLGMENSTYANYEEARAAFWQDVMLFELLLFEDEYNQRLSSNDTYRFMFDTSKIPALRDDILDRASAAKTLWDMGTPLNIAVKTAGIEMQEIDGGDISYISGALVSSDEQDDEMLETDDQEQETQDEQNDDEQAVDQDDDDEMLEQSIVMPREAIKAMINRQISIIKRLDANYSEIGAFFDSFAIDSYRDIFKRYNVTPGHLFFTQLNAQLKSIAVNIAKSGYAKQYPNEWVINTIIYALERVTGVYNYDIAYQPSLISKSVQSHIDELEQTILYGNVSKASVTILFTDGEVIITDEDVDQALADVKDDELLYGLLNSTLDDESDDNG